MGKHAIWAISRECARPNHPALQRRRTLDRSAMDQVQLNEFRQALITLREEIEQLETVSGDASDTVSLDQTKVGRLSRMDAMQAQQMAQETQRRRQLQLVRIRAALNRLDEDDYGYCLACGEEIGLGRLRIDPSATHCIGCADR